MSNTADQRVLSLESAIGGGSISLFADGIEIGGYIGTAGASRSEDLLPNIERLLKRFEIPAAALSRIVVSAGPGSFTGIRIGIATALGLSNALDIPIRQLSLLAAIAYCRPHTGKFTVALPVGRATACIQSFEVDDDRVTPLTNISTMSTDEFRSKAADRPEGLFLTTGYLLAEAAAEQIINVRDLGDGLAAYLARAAIGSDIADTPEPLFISKQTAA